MEYTKGKWTITKWSKGYGFNIFSDSGGFIASVPLNQGFKHTMSETKANAHLIASAPKLCEALKFVSNQIIAWTDFRPELTSYTKLATETIDEALAEAEGK